MDPRARVHPQQALAVYVEPLAAGRHVAVFGDASLGLATRLAELGARSVHVWDPDAARARREADLAPRSVVVRPLSGDELEPRSGPYDLAVVPDLLLFDDVEDLLARVRRLVGDDGVALVGAPNDQTGQRDPDSLDYYELFDLVAGEFDDVTMIAQLRFRGVALAELGREEEESPAVSVDTQLADPDRAPEAFLALASQHAVKLEPYAIVELPEPIEEPSEQANDESSSVARAHALLRTEALVAEVDALRLRLVEADRLARSVPALEEALLVRGLRLDELEAALVDRARQLARLSEEVERARAAGELARALASQMEALAARAERAERALAAAEPELARAAESHAGELARCEDALRERGQFIARLEVELARRERMVEELVDTLEEGAHIGGGKPTPEPSDALPDRDAVVEEVMLLRHKLDALALELARREGEAQASAWTIAELERRLESAAERPDGGVGGSEKGAEKSGDDVRKPDHRLLSALDELDVLRRALAQEHEARLRAESGEELARARAEIDRQAALLAGMQDRPH